MILSHIIVIFFVFIRIGGCLMIAPGFSSDRVPVRSRLYFSAAVSLLISPIVENQIIIHNHKFEFFYLLTLILKEIFIGLIYGFMCRIFLFAVDTLITTFCFTIGLSNIFNAALFNNDSSPSLSSLLLLASIQLIFITDLHHYIIRFFNHYFQIIPLGAVLDVGQFTEGIVDMLSESYLIALRLSSPFLLFAVIVNLSFAFLARLSPHLPIYFFSGPFVIFLGVYVFHIYSSDLLSSLISSLNQLIAHG